MFNGIGIRIGGNGSGGGSAPAPAAFPLPANGLSPQIDAFFGGGKYTKDGSTEVGFADIFTHTRNSDLSTYVDADGIIKTVSFNVPRTDHHVNGVKGYLHEPQGRNEMIWANDFTNAAWVKEFCNVTANQTASPDGTVNADLITATGSASVHRFYQAVGGNGTIRSFFVKAGTASYVSISRGAVADGYVLFNVTTGVVEVQSGTGVRGTIEPYANGFYRCTIHGGQGQFNVLSIGTTIAQATPDTTWNASGETVYVWGGFAQIGGTDITSFIYTNAAKVTRLPDVAFIPVANIPYPSGSPLAVSIAVEGYATYSDNNEFNESTIWQWLADTNNFLEGQISSFPSAELWYFLSKSLGSQQDSGHFLPSFFGTNVPMNVASRHGVGFLQSASLGTAAVTKTTGTTFPNLTTRNLFLGQKGAFHFTRFRMWGGATGNIAEAGLIEATS